MASSTSQAAQIHAKLRGFSRERIRSSVISVTCIAKTFESARKVQNEKEDSQVLLKHQISYTMDSFV